LCLKMGVVRGQLHDNWAGLAILGGNCKGMVDWEGLWGLEAGKSLISLAWLRTGRIISLRTMLGMEVASVLLPMGSPWMQMVDDLEA
jgi:hypothetical protein